MRASIALALLSAALFGASTPLAKLLLDGVDPWLMAGLLYLGAGVGLAGVHVARGALGVPAAEAPLRRADVPWLALVVLAGGVAGPLCLMLGLARTEATSASLLLNLEGLATMASHGWRSARMWTAACCWGPRPFWPAPPCCRAARQRRWTGARG